MLWDTERSGRGTGGEAYWNAIILLRLFRIHLSLSYERWMNTRYFKLSLYYYDFIKHFVLK